MQAEMLGKLLHAKRQSHRGSQPLEVSKSDLSGLSDKAQKQAARIVDFALGMVTCKIPACCATLSAAKAPNENQLWLCQ